MKNPSLIGPVLRVASVLALCAACFQTGRWYQELSGGPVVKRDAGNELVHATHARGAAPEEKIVEPRPLVAAGDPPGEGGDIITPLNVRDPSALVMGPGGGALCPPAASIVEPPPVPQQKRRRKEPLESGRLLDLLRRDGVKGAPQHY